VKIVMRGPKRGIVWDGMIVTRFMSVEHFRRIIRAVDCGAQSRSIGKPRCTTPNAV
jgi:hypothetical protein